MGIISSTRQWDSSQPHRAIADGLARIGCRVEVREYAKNWPLFDERPDAIFIWNGRNSSSLDIVRKAEEEGITVFRMEHGFFDRMAYTQVDHAGILHWASWADCLGLDEPAPPDGAERLSRVWPWPPADFGPRRSGKVLVLGQVPGDSQLQASEVRLPRHLTRIVRDNLSPKFQPVFRPHPRCDRLHLRQVRMPDAAGSLVDAIREARFVVTINSNAGNEALALGCPVLAFGPALYLQAGVARLATQETIAEDLAAMAAGWRPETEKVHEYLRWLACRQWNVAEFSDGEVLRPLLAAAGLAARETPDDENGENSENSVKETDVRVVEHAA